MDRATAAQTQYLRNSYYTVWLVNPAGERQRIGMTGRKSMRGLMDVLVRPRVQEIVAKEIPNADSVTFRKAKGALVLSNGWRIEFGGTILQEAE